MAIYKGSELIKPNDISRIYLGGELLWQNEEWRAMTSTESIPVTVTHTTDPKKYIYEVVTVAGTPGEKKHTWEEKFVNGVSTGEKRNASTITTRAMTPSKQVKGTKDWMLCSFDRASPLGAQLIGKYAMPVSGRPLRAKDINGHSVFQSVWTNYAGEITSIRDDYLYYWNFKNSNPILKRSGNTYIITHEQGYNGPDDTPETNTYRVLFEVL